MLLRTRAISPHMPWETNMGVLGLKLDRGISLTTTIIGAQTIQPLGGYGEHGLSLHHQLPNTINLVGLFTIEHSIFMMSVILLALWVTIGLIFILVDGAETVIHATAQE